MCQQNIKHQERLKMQSLKKIQSFEKCSILLLKRDYMHKMFYVNLMVITKKKLQKMLKGKSEMRLNVAIKKTKNNGREKEKKKKNKEEQQKPSENNDQNGKK